MRKYYNILVAILFILPLMFVSCDKNNTGTEPEVDIPELTFNADNIRVKQGADNKFTLQITSGGGEYNAFPLNNDVAKTTISGNSVLIEGLANGITSIVVSDKNGRYSRVPVTVYTTDVMTLADTELTMVTRLGRPARATDQATTSIVLSNGGMEGAPNAGFAISVNDERVTASIENRTDENDATTPIVIINGTSAEEPFVAIVIINGTSAEEPFVAIVTITDISGVSAKIEVTVESTLIPYNEEEMAMLAFINTARRYQVSMNGSLWGSTASSGIGTPLWINRIEDGQQVYGYDSTFNNVWFRLWWTGDKSVGVKTDGRFTHARQGTIYPDIPTPVPARVEVVRNDGTNIWVVYSFVHEGQLRWGYFVDTI